MTWNYRAIRHSDGSMALHEVYYDDAGRPEVMTKDPIIFAVSDEETLDDLAAALERALADVRRHSILDAGAFVTRQAEE